MYIVGIAGGSGSGKTTFAQKILNSVGSPNVVILHQDSYYLPVPPEHLQVHGEGNFDHPDAFDWPLLRAHLKTLKEGGIISVPVYDYKISRRTSEVELIGPCQVVLLEGIYSLWDETIRDLFDVKVYLHVDADIRFIRRLHRDVRERGRTLDGIIRQYYDTVRPMYRNYLEPTQQFANVVVGEETDIAAQMVAAQVERWLKV